MNAPTLTKVDTNLLTLPGLHCVEPSLPGGRTDTFLGIFVPKRA